MAVSVNTRTERGAEAEVTLEKTNPGEGSIRLRVWPAGSDSAASRPQREDNYQLYDIITSADGATTNCRAVAPGSDPNVTITFEGGITIDVRGTSFRLGDGRTTYQLTPEAQQRVRDFLVESFAG